MRRIADLTKTVRRPMPAMPPLSPKPPVRCRTRYGPCHRPDEVLAAFTLVCDLDDDLAGQITRVKPYPRVATPIHPALEQVLEPRLNHPAVCAPW